MTLMDNTARAGQEFYFIFELVEMCNENHLKKNRDGNTYKM